MDRPIPAFYCVYLLRSTTALSARARVYIGSTPDPKRRLRQHNGEIKGGAKSTNHDRRRPWEMALLVTGFPSKIAALQFEWSWQHTYLTRHVPTEDKNTLTYKERMNWRGKMKKTPSPPTQTMSQKLADLHILLRANSFRRWPLDVRFFNSDAYQHWQTKTTTSTPFRIPNYTRVVFEGGAASTGPGPGSNPASGPPGGVNALDVSYHPMLHHVRKSHTLLAATSGSECAVCKGPMVTSKDLFAVCPNGDCATTIHLTCFTAHFARGTIADSMLLPITGVCPSCDLPISWSSLAREASLRIRGQRDTEKLLKPARIKKATAATRVDLSEPPSDTESQDSILVRDDIIAGRFYDEEDAMPDVEAAAVPDSDWDDIEDLSV